MKYRNLTDAEIEQLKSKGCLSDDWSKVTVHPETDLSRIMDVCFRGSVVIGKLDGMVEVEDGRMRPSSISHSVLENCVIGDHCYIADVALLRNYHVASHVVLENVRALSVGGESTFGNGTEIEILNEGGGRSLKLFDTLSAQFAYLYVLYRHDGQLIRQMEAIVDHYVESVKSAFGTIGDHAKIIRCDQLLNVRVGSHARLQGVSLLQNGTIISNESAPVKIGTGVVARNFIIQSGSQVTDGALLTDCFVGQSVRLGRQFSAENSAFFANSEGFHSEAVSLFAGPYSVTHHKSTLLIAAMTSFYNAGSGTNQSNHMYKLGPLHQGILERGAKTGSFSYMLWPSRVGPFTAVIGKHYTNFDAADMPFSYIEEVEGKSLLTPGMNLFTVGTRRDSAKWLKRDRRSDSLKLDLIHFDLFSPFVINRVLKGREALKALYEGAKRQQEFVKYKGLSIKRLLLRQAIKNYNMAIKIFLGEQILRRLQAIGDVNDMAAVRQALKPEESVSLENWYDLLGLFIAESRLQNLLAKIKGGAFATADQLYQALKAEFEAYEAQAWAWTAALLKAEKGIDVANISKEDLRTIINEWKENKQRFNKMIMADAQKEFDANSRIAYGIDGDQEVRDADFEAVRGRYEANSFVQELLSENEEIEAIAAKWTA